MAPHGGQIVVVGGYGAVGQVLAPRLGEWFPGRVVVAGRRLGEARKLADRFPGALAARRFDVRRPAEYDEVLRDATVVVMCVESGNEALARECLRRGVSYVDICATSSVLDGIAFLDGLAVRSGASAVLSVGLAPGVTNLLARHCVDRLPDASSVDITLLLGAGGDHGPDSVRWTVEHLAEPGGWDPSAPARRREWLPGFGWRTAYTFPFSDQRTLTSLLGIPVTTRLCFDSPALTTLLFGLRATRLFTAVRRLGGNPALAAALGRLHTGTDRFAVCATATGKDGERVWCAAEGRRECAATAAVAAQVVRRLYTRGAAAGVWHIDEVFDAEPFLRELPPERFTLHWAPPDASAAIR